MEYGYALSSEEHRPRDLVANAVKAEQLDFSFASISDHFHPWLDSQGQSAFVWAVLGGIANATERLRVGTGVTCPLIRVHPAILAQAAATVADMMPGRFMFGVGTGENLNEHVLGDKWPATEDRREMLIEAIAVIRQLWTGDLTSHHGDFYDVENARIYTLPDVLPPICVAASGPEAAELAAEHGDGIWNNEGDPAVLEKFVAAGGTGPRITQLTLCYADSVDAAVTTVARKWPLVGFKGPLNQELPLPSHFELASAMVTEDVIRGALPLGPDPEPVLRRLSEYADAGYDHVYLHQIGSDQVGFFDFWERELRPQLG